VVSPRLLTAEARPAWRFAAQLTHGFEQSVPESAFGPLYDAGGNQVAQGGVVVTRPPQGNAVTTGFVTATTNANGLAVFSNLSITGLVGTYRITFSATGFASTESNDIVLGPGLASRLVFLTQPAGAANAQPLTQQPSLQLTDVSGNVVASAGVNVTAALASGPGTLGGTLVANTDASGIATFANLSISGAAGAYTIGFTAPGVAQVVSDPIGLGAGIPTQLGVTTQPSATAASGAVFAQQPVIQLRDASNNPVAQAGVTITAAIASGGGTLLGIVIANTNASGVATFGTLAISGIVGNRTLQFTATGLATATSNTIAITPGAATKLALTVQPSPTASSGDPFPQQPVVQIQDNEGNAVAQAGTAITAAIETGAGGTLGGGTLVITNGSGQAAFTNLALTGTSGNYTLRFTGGGLTQVISTTIGLGAGAASNLAIATQPSASVQSGVAFPQQPAIQLQDGSNNPVAQAGVVITVTILSGNPALGGRSMPRLTPQAWAVTNLAITGLIGAHAGSSRRAGSGSRRNTITVTPVLLPRSIHHTAAGRGTEWSLALTAAGGAPRRSERQRREPGGRERHREHRVGRRDAGRDRDSCDQRIGCRDLHQPQHQRTHRHSYPGVQLGRAQRRHAGNITPRRARPAS
jgi:hypothetical protein